MNLVISDEELQSRLSQLPVFEPPIKRGWLGRYAQHVLSANTGAVMDNINA